VSVVIDTVVLRDLSTGSAVQGRSGYVKASTVEFIPSALLQGVDGAALVV
jgi:hypothetical protein